MKYQIKRRSHKKLGNKNSVFRKRIRLCVTKSNQHIYAQVINDSKNITLCACSTLEYKIRSQIKKTSTCHAAKIVGNEIALRSIKNNIYNVVFDKNHQPYHGKIKAFADAAREAGLHF